MKFEANPDQTWAIVVGIEKYVADWPLDGPASDAVRFMKWLRAHEVPPNHIFAFLSPLEKNETIATYCENEGIVRTDPTRDVIEKFLTETLPEKLGNARKQSAEDQMLLLFWGGHGVVTDKLERRLFYANASVKDKLSVPVDSIRALLQSQRYAPVSTEVAIIDACANHYREMRSDVEIKGGEIAGDERTAAGIKQYFLYSAEAGQVSANNDQVKSGKFSALVLAELCKSPTYPPDFIAIHENVRKTFDEPRNAAEIRQTPVLYVSDITGGEQVRCGEIPVFGRLRDLNAYLAAVEKTCERIPYEFLLHKMSARSSEFPTLSDLYMPQTVEEQRVKEAQFAKLHDPSRNQELPRRSSLDDLMAQKAGNVVLEGDPGSGKSSGLRHLALKMIREWRSGEQSSFLPILVASDVLAPLKGNSSESLHRAVEQTLGWSVRESIPADLFQGPPARHGLWLVLVDALDEVVDGGQQNNLINSILQAAAPADAPYRFVVSTRPIEAVEQFGNGHFSFFRLLPWSSLEVEEFVRKWLTTQGPHGVEVTEAFLAGLERLRIPYTPLLLAMAAVVFRRDAAGGRVAIYRAFIDALFHRDDQETRAQIQRRWGQLTGDQLFDGRMDILKDLALYARSGGADALAVEAFRFSIKKKWLPPDYPVDVDAMKELLATTGVVVRRDDRQDFIHKTFEEYLSAAALDAQTRNQPRQQKKLVRLWKDQTQREVVLFLLGIWAEAKKDVNAHIQKIASSGEEGARFAGAAIAEITVTQELETRIIQCLLDQGRKFGWREIFSRQHPTALEVLGMMRGRKDVQSGLLGLARSGNYLVDERAVDALAQLGYVDDLRNISVEPKLSAYLRVAAARHLGKHDLKVAERTLTAIAVLGSDNPGMFGAEAARREAAAALGQMGFQRHAQCLAIDLLLDEMSSGYGPWIGTAKFLGELGRKEEAVEFLFQTLLQGDSFRLYELVSAFGELRAISKLLGVRKAAADPTQIAIEAFHWLYENGIDDLAPQVLAEMLVEARKAGYQTIHPAFIFRGQDSERLLARVVTDQRLDEGFRDAAKRYLLTISDRSRPLRRAVRPIRMVRVSVERTGQVCFARLKTLVIALSYLGLPFIRILGNRRYIGYLRRVAFSRNAWTKQRGNALFRILEEGDEQTRTETVRRVLSDPDLSVYTVSIAVGLFVDGFDEDAWCFLTTAPEWAREYFLEQIVQKKIDAVPALVLRLLRGEASVNQAGVIEYIAKWPDSSLLERIVRDNEVKPRLRALALRKLGEIRDDLYRGHGRVDEPAIWVHLDAVNQLARNKRISALWATAEDRDTDARVRRFAVWWLGLLDDGAEVRLRPLAEAEPDERIRRAIDDACTLLALREQAQSIQTNA